MRKTGGNSSQKHSGVFMSFSRTFTNTFTTESGVDKWEKCVKKIAVVLMIGVMCLLSFQNRKMETLNSRISTYQVSIQHMERSLNTSIEKLEGMYPMP